MQVSHKTLRPAFFDLWPPDPDTISAIFRAVQIHSSFFTLLALKQPGDSPLAPHGSSEGSRGPRYPHRFPDIFRKPRQSPFSPGSIFSSGSDPGGRRGRDILHVVEGHGAAGGHGCAQGLELVA